MSERGLRILEAGTRVRVPKGTPIVYDTSSENRKVVGRTQIIKVHHQTHFPPTIYWAGAGGYWKGVLLTDDLEVLTLKDSPGDVDASRGQTQGAVP